MTDAPHDDFESESHLYNPAALQGRLALQESPEAFIKKLEWTQHIPCHWGDLRKKNQQN
ncbi:MAG: hypothetical protein ACD_28C00224G0011 [uncultured bacterium]|nr:MAG: hypothetical protein ACD_28C00224G0011 [uncultured bacterium]KKT72702.1 MAG: hypothetical protein UW70_C0102G0008 [Candidatus Peregrinibacteria bacterium GW2011_GWA2_44_7]